MKNTSLIALFLHGLSWGSAKEEILPEVISFSIPGPLVNKWIAQHAGKDFTVEFFMDRKDRHFTFSIAQRKTPLDPTASPTTVPSLCHFARERGIALHAVGTLTYTDPITGHILYLIP